MRRREAGLPEHLKEAPGVMLKHNPGMSLLWWTEQVRAFNVGPPKGRRQLLFDIGEPLYVEWWTGGRQATRAEAEESIAAGLPKLWATISEADEEGRADLQQSAERLRRWLPKENP